MKILIADDSKLARLTLKKALTENEIDMQILEAHDGVEAVELVQKEKFDIVFLDLSMPNMDGFEALEKIIGYDPHIKVVIVSADIQSYSHEKVLTIGAKMMIEKPASAAKIKNILSQLL